MELLSRGISIHTWSCDIFVNVSFLYIYCTWAQNSKRWRFQVVKFCKLHRTREGDGFKSSNFVNCKTFLVVQRSFWIIRIPPAHNFNQRDKGDGIERQIISRRRERNFVEVDYKKELWTYLWYYRLLLARVIRKVCFLLWKDNDGGEMDVIIIRFDYEGKQRVAGLAGLT